MKYTYNALTKAINLVLPNMVEAQNKGMQFDFPTLIDMAAIQIFKENWEDNGAPSYYHRIASWVIREALQELTEQGWITEGTEDERELLSL